MNIYWLKFNALFVICESDYSRCQLAICQLFIKRPAVAIRKLFLAVKLLKIFCTSREWKEEFNESRLPLKIIIAPQNN